MAKRPPLDPVGRASAHVGSHAATCLCRTVYAFPNQRKEPLTDAQHVRNAVARFDQVIGVSDADRALAFANMVA
jgi:hypothetical protein